MSIRVLICDDHEVIRTGLASLLAGTDIEIIGEAATGKDALRLAMKVSCWTFACPTAMDLPLWRSCCRNVPKSKVECSHLRRPPIHCPIRRLGRRRLVLKGSARDSSERSWPPPPASRRAAGRTEEVAATMKVRQVLDDDDVPLTQRETQVLNSPRSPGPKQQGNRQVARNQRRDRQGTRPKHFAQDHCQRSHASRGLAVRKGLV